MAGPWDGIDEVAAVAETGSFVGAARRLDVSVSHISRAVARCEDRLQVQLFARTTRSVRVTDTGRLLVEQFQRLIAEREEAFAMIEANGAPQGALRVTCSIALGERFVAPVLRSFAQLYPSLNVELDLSNRVVDLISEGYDLAIRTGALTDTRLLRRQICTRQMTMCAAPAYLSRRGIPRTIADLDKHDCLVGSTRTWQLAVDGALQSYRPVPRWQCNSGMAITEAAIAGMGVCHLPTFYLSDALASGQLVQLLQAHHPPAEPVWAVYPQRRHLLPKVRRVVDLLAANLGNGL
ncbi:LysR family transcriptional regulator [Sphingomonas sp.]|uniref:LysR family transcriptional regulator n=1 Tax=Sphingomonas sp. TaxID=28214 RepID=UPI0017BEE450|nr:LysR family transcriptional regulator [Sphingomonas sp.]MBA4761805.1 LysR family transcriptional regulator [Sphingomonas sp.]